MVRLDVAQQARTVPDEIVFGLNGPGCRPAEAPQVWLLVGRPAPVEAPEDEGQSVLPVSSPALAGAEALDEEEWERRV